MHKLLVNRLLKPAKEKVWLSELTVPQWPKLLTWDVKQQKQPTTAPDNMPKSGQYWSLRIWVVDWNF